MAPGGLPLIVVDGDAHRWAVVVDRIGFTTVSQLQPRLASTPYGLLSPHGSGVGGRVGESVG
jgi:hypothetical protein